jgi:hypothetical protein
MLDRGAKCLSPPEEELSRRKTGRDKGKVKEAWTEQLMMRLSAFDPDLSQVAPSSQGQSDELQNFGTAREADVLPASRPLGSTHPALLCLLSNRVVLDT